MSDIKDGGPAFPDPGRAQSKKQRDLLGNTGMTLRDWFAGMAMQGMWADQLIDMNFADRAKSAYRMADAMLKEREV